jgi:drug/metabolite transporter (DMT)-like permease
MIYLLLQVVFASAFTLVIKWTHVRGRENVITIGAINYIVAAISVLPVFLLNNPSPVSWGAIWTGGSMGVVYFIAFFFAIYAIKSVGAASATVVSVLSILLPIAVAAAIWNEHPNAWQTSGIGLALLALLLIGGQTNRAGSPDVETARRWVIPVVLFSFFLLCGCSRLAQDTFKHVSQPDQLPAFLISAFGIAGTASVIMLLYRRRKILPMEMVFGVSLGLANILQSHFVLKSLEFFEGFIVFPVTSAGAITLTTIVATALLGERLTGRTCVGIAVSVVALFLLPPG